MKKAKPSASSGTQPAVKRSSPPVLILSEAQRVAAAILEVLAGVRAPSAAAELLSISLPRYYQLETRALEGLVVALAPRSKGKQPSLEKRVQQLEKELAAAQRQCARQEALVRVTQRSLGLAALATPKNSPPAKAGKGRQPRRPMSRALKAAQQLRARADAANAGNSSDHSLQPTAPTGGAEEASP